MLLSGKKGAEAALQLKLLQAKGNPRATKAKGKVAWQTALDAVCRSVNCIQDHLV
jgi:hypothetical protein